MDSDIGVLVQTRTKHTHMDMDGNERRHGIEKKREVGQDDVWFVVRTRQVTRDSGGHYVLAGFSYKCNAIYFSSPANVSLPNCC